MVCALKIITCILYIIIKIKSRGILAPSGGNYTSYTVQYGVIKNDIELVSAG